MATPKYTKAQFDADFPDDEACLRWLMQVRHGGTHITCPGCKAPSKFHRMGKRRAFACQYCGHHIFPCAGTILEKSRTPLTKWFYALYLLTASRHGVPAREMERQLGVTFKCAWRICHELRKLMAKADLKFGGGAGGQLKGHVEVDESYFGPRSNRPGIVDKTPVIGMTERDGRLRAKPLTSTRAGEMTGEIDLNVAQGSRISTDEHKSYAGLTGMGYRHETVEHSAKEFARGDVHVNSLEGFWSRLKVSIRGTHVHVSQKHLDKYVGEFACRYNMRKRPERMFRAIISSL
jgi:DNA-directed RNA polymerase subunit RPC12/RpoP